MTEFLCKSFIVGLVALIAVGSIMTILKEFIDDWKGFCTFLAVMLGFFAACILIGVAILGLSGGAIK